MGMGPIPSGFQAWFRLGLGLIAGCWVRVQGLRVKAGSGDRGSAGAGRGCGGSGLGRGGTPLGDWGGVLGTRDDVVIIYIYMYIYICIYIYTHT